ncbi:MAG: HAMP domain-containing histidine kinase [Campylobacteraceae bacterium]|nr:HAMP domain-containing histidine kinase [Campylobacteraceae bacterium]
MFEYTVIFVFFTIILWMYLSSKKRNTADYNQKLEAEVKKQLLELRHKDKLLIAQSKLAAVGETLAHIAHQWKQPLSQINSVVLNIEADFEDKKLSKEVLEDHLNEIEKMTFYMSDTIESFNTYLQPSGSIEYFSMKDAFDTSFELLYKLLESRRIECKLEIIEDSFVKGIKKEFVQALLVLLNNARDVLIEQKIKYPKIHIRIHKIDNKAVFEILDNGGGIKDKYFDKIFDPYFTTKPHSQGTGHGLCMAKMIIEKSMHGTLNVKNDENGAKFSIFLTSEKEPK